MLLQPYFRETMLFLMNEYAGLDLIIREGACFLLLGDKVSARVAFQDSIDCIPERMDYPLPYDGLSNC